VVLSSLAGYAFARLRFPGLGLVAVAVLMTQMLPGVLLLMPLFVLVWKLGLLNTLFSLVLVTTAFALPFSLWTMRGYFLSVPSELEEAARTDGCSELSALFRVVMPLVGPGAAAVGIFAFTVAWQEYVFALSFLNRISLWTVPVGLNAFISQFGANWPEMCAAGVMATAPIILLFALLQRYFITGITAGAVKE
jgi:ABC-type glycerol-3-phosphate transport system permease component